MTKAISAMLEIRDGGKGPMVCCRSCGQALAPLGTSWKAVVRRRDVSMHGVGGTAYTGADEAVLRQFCCNGCGALLDSEMALPDEPFLEDVVKL